MFSVEDRGRFVYHILQLVMWSGLGPDQLEGPFRGFKRAESPMESSTAHVLSWKWLMYPISRRDATSPLGRLDGRFDPSQLAAAAPVLLRTRLRWSTGSWRGSNDNRASTGGGTRTRETNPLTVKLSPVYSSRVWGGVFSMLLAARSPPDARRYASLGSPSSEWPGQQACLLIWQNGNAHLISISNPRSKSVEGSSRVL